MPSLIKKLWLPEQFSLLAERILWLPERFPLLAERVVSIAERFYSLAERISSLPEQFSSLAEQFIWPSERFFLTKKWLLNSNKKLPTFHSRALKNIQFFYCGKSLTLKKTTSCFISNKKLSFLFSINYFFLLKV
ncbi:hypothetical protein ABFY60_01740 [Lysinibacillus pakistanensis]|uniref:hypothetical protein n=1 Tax=Lysinibacillus pakistanensis TaxID=759811 RepID=UPI003D2B0920